MHAHDHRIINGTLAAALAFSVCLLVSLLLARYIAQPQWETFGATHARIASLNKTLSDPHGIDSIITRLLAQQDSLTGKFHDLSLHFGDTKDLPGALRLLIEKANVADIQFIKMQPRSEGAPDKDGRYPIVLEMTAPYHSLGRFIASLEAVPHMIHVDRLSITANRNAMLDIRIQLTCYL
jgi:Tfp pilus assembly protein PilO